MTSLKGSRAFLTSHVSGHFFQALQAVERGERKDKIHVRRPSGWMWMAGQMPPEKKHTYFLSLAFS